MYAPPGDRQRDRRLCGSRSSGRVRKSDGDGARAELAALLRGLPTSLAVHLYVGQRCAEHGMATEALTWLTRGVILAERRREYGLGMALLLSARCGLREAQGLPADDWDHAAERLIEEMERRTDDDGPAEQTGLVAVTSRHGADTVVDLVTM